VGVVDDGTLNEPQIEAVEHVDGPLLVFAGAGSGKTRVITYRIANLVANHHVPPYRILAVTFTNKAAGEMRERLDQLLGHDLARDLAVGTFHAVCARLIRRHHAAVGLTKNFVIYDDADQKGVVSRIVKEMELDDRRYPPRLLLSTIHKHKQEGRTPAEVEASSYVDDVVAKVFEAYEKQLRACNACDFDDLLLHVLRLVELPEGESEAAQAGRAIRAQFRHVLVDELQDTNAVQYRLVSAMVRDHGNLAVVGDDDQSIYRWRGADVRNIRGFSREFPSARVVRLEQNYRSTARIVRAALAVIEPSKQRVPKALWTQNADGGLVEVRAASDERDEASQVARIVDACMREGWSRRELAILYRTHAQSRVLEEAMRAARIPYKIVGGLKFFDRAEVKDLLAYLRVVVNPRSDVDLLRVINVPARGIGGTTVERLQATATSTQQSVLDAVRAVAAGSLDAGVGTGPRKKLGTFVQIVETLTREHEAGMLPSELAEKALEVTGYAAALEAEDNDEADTRLQNLGELVGSIRDYEEAARAEGTEPTISGFLEKTALVTAGDENRAKAAGHSDDLVTMMTVHAAKGLEFRGVMITGLEDELFPYKGFRANDDDAPVSMTMLSAEEEDLEEERRLAYVAITRAKEKLTLFYATQRTLFGQTRYNRPSRFLRDLPPEVVEHVANSRRDAPLRSGWGSAPPPSNQPAGARVPFRHPMAPTTPARVASPSPGEHFVVLDPDTEGGDVRRGGVVRHKRFGEGAVLDVVEGAEPKVVAQFPGWGTMTILRRYLEVVRS
jgi:DNA helicase-2/ATP-dependent DNA helicase PcrA